MMKFILDIVSTPAILVALIAILGLVLQKKKLPDIIKGGIKTFVGFLVVSGGAGIVQNSLNPFGTMFEHAFHLSGVVPNNEAIVAVALTTYGSATAMIMFAGMVFNILIARFTRFKYIFLTGHHTLYMACMIAVILSVAGFTSLPLILLGGLALGIIMSISPAFVQKYMVQLTGNDKVALGHFSSLGYWLSGFTGSLIGDKSKSTEDIKFPKSLAFLRDSTVSITLSMAVIYIIVAIFAGSEYIEKEISNGTSGLVYALQLAGQFAAGVFVILAGVRLILGEIVPAFKGISERLVPNSKPALDCPIVYTYAPNAVLIGFISSFVGGLVSMAIMIASGTVVILPGVVPHFFCGATAGVIGNASGGVRGATIGAFLQGILISFLPVFLMLRKFATKIRLNTLRTLNHLGFGHYGGSLSIVEVLAVLYGEIMPMTPEIFASRDRDYFVLSKGHAGPALYSTLYLNGFFDKEFLYSLNTNGTKLPSHPDRNLTPGIDMTTGSLGQGISVATGLAYGQRIRKSPFYTYAIVGDGELNEGQCWEAIQFASHQQLSNLIVFVDDNKKQLDGFTKDI